MPYPITDAQVDEFTSEVVNGELAYGREMKERSGTELDVYAAGMRVGIHEMLVLLEQRGFLDRERP